MEHKLKNIMRLLFFYCFAGGVYMTIELLYRQYTDYKMFYLAGFVGLVILGVNEWLSYDTDFLVQVFVCGTVALLGEFLCGIIFNADYAIWDYRDLPFNLMGQIQLYFAVIWYILSAAFIPILDCIDYIVFPEVCDTKPYYKILNKKFKLIK